MARTKISEFSATPGNNTDIDGINIAEGCAPSGINDAIRELMSQLKDFQAGTAGDSFNGPVGTTTAAAGAFTTLSASSTVSGTGFSNYLASPPAIGGTVAAAGSFTTLSASSTVTLSGGTANGVLYLNGSKVATSGSALTFDGASNFSYGGSNASTYNTLNVNNTSATGFARILFNVGSSGANGIAAIKYAPGVFMQIGPDANDTTTPLVFAVNNGSEQMRLTSTGLGVGTSSPAVKLDVNGSVNISSGQNLTWGGAYAANIPTMYAVSGANGYFYWSPRGNTGSYMTLDANSNLGLGVTPSAWASGAKALQIKSYGALYESVAGKTTLTFNSYESATNTYKYLQTEAASMYQQVSGGHYWFTAPSGTAGNAISFTQAMTLDASGNLLVGTTSANGRLTVDSGAGGLMGSFNSTNANGGYLTFSTSSTVYGDIGTAAQAVGGSASDFGINARGSRNLVFGTVNTERARIDSSGNLLVGTTTQSGKVTISYAYPQTGIALTTDSTSTQSALSFSNPNGTVGTINTSGSATSYNTSSDYRLKDNPQPLTGSGVFIDALQPKTWNWKADGSKGVGFIAHEVQEVSPSSVVGEKDGEQMQAMEYGSAEFIANIIAELQSLRKRVAQLEKGN